MNDYDANKCITFKMKQYALALGGLIKTLREHYDKMLDGILFAPLGV